MDVKIKACSRLVALASAAAIKEDFVMPFAEHCEQETKGDLVQRGLEGDSNALELLFGRYEQALYRNALRLLGNEDEARDALQDGMLSAFKNLHRFEGRSKFSTWLTRIVINAALMRRRRANLHETVSLDEEAQEDKPALADQLEDPRPDPEQLAMQGELHHLLESHLQTLPPHLREALVLRHMDELSTQEVAQTMGVGENTLKSRVRRARLQMASRRSLAAYTTPCTG
jgi:RNA polymerase sigma-70 factor (ECF subfamily)